MRRLLLALMAAACLAGTAPREALAVKVVVDAGHGGSDPGAVGINGLQEKDVNLDIAFKLKDELARRGYEVVMSRVDDQYISLQGRVDFTKAQQADLFVSIHANWYQNPATRGSMVLYYDDAYPQESYPASDEMKVLTPLSKQLAQNVETALVHAAGTQDNGLVPSAVFVVRRGDIPSILVETAFLSNKQDAAMLADNQVRSVMAGGIADGILAFELPVFPDVTGHWAKESILKLKNKGIVTGRSSRFYPDEALTRAEFVTMLDRVFGFSRQPWTNKCTTAAVTGAVYQTTVTGAVYQTQPGCVAVGSDLSDTHWASQTMHKALELGLIDGYPDGTVKPDKAITREEAAVLLNRMIVASGHGSPAGEKPPAHAFTDVPDGWWSGNAIALAKAAGLINGVTDTTFAPFRMITRAEISVILDRYLK